MHPDTRFFVGAIALMIVACALVAITAWFGAPIEWMALAGVLIVAAGLPAVNYVTRKRPRRKNPPPRTSSMGWPDPRRVVRGS